MKTEESHPRFYSPYEEGLETLQAIARSQDKVIEEFRQKGLSEDEIKDLLI